MVFTKLTSGVWNATKKAFSWADRKLGKGADFIDEQWRTRARPAIEDALVNTIGNTFGKRAMDGAANTVGNFIDGSLAPARLIFNKAIPLMEALPQIGAIKSITEAIRDTNDYATSFGDKARDYVSPGSVERNKAPPKKQQPSSKDSVPSEKQPSKEPIPTAVTRPIHADGSSAHQSPSGTNLKPPSSNPIGLSPRPKPQIRTRKMNSGRLKLTENPWTTNVWNDGFNAKYTFHNQSIYGSNRG